MATLLSDASRTSGAIYGIAAVQFRLLEKELIETPDAKTIEEVSSFLNQEKDKFVKTLIYSVDGKPYACLVKGSDEVNETKLRKLLNATEVVMASPEVVESVTGAIVGFAGPINLDIPIIMDSAAMMMKNFVVGANKTNYHYRNVNISDFFEYNWLIGK